MNKTEKVHELIKSLTKSEKRFFKIYSSRHVIGEENKYVLLFDAIDKMQKYDEELLKTQFANEKFINRLAVTKNYLYELVLKSMSAFHQQNSVINQIYEQLQQVNFLYSKNLLIQANTLLQKTRKLAEQTHCLEILPEINEWQKKLIEADNYKTTEESLTQLFEDCTKINDEIELVNNFWLLQAKLYNQHNLKGIIKNKKDFNDIEDIFSARFMQLDERELNFKSLLLKNKIYSTYFFQLRDYESCYVYIRKIVDIIESQEIKSNALIKEHVQAVNNLLNITFALKKKEEYKKYNTILNKYYNEKENYKSQLLRVKIVEAYHYHKMNALMNNSNNKESKAHLVKFDNDIKKYNGKLNNIGKSMMYFQAFHLSFNADDFEGADSWLQKIINAGKTNSRSDIYAFAKVLKLITLYEMDNKKELKAALKYLYKSKVSTIQNTKFDELLVDSIKKLPKLNGKYTLNEWMGETLSSINELKKDPFERKVLDYFKFEDWLKAKLKIKKAVEKVALV